MTTDAMDDNRRTSVLVEGTPPMLVLHVDALRNNVARMQDFCRSRGVDLAPHAKTSMAPYVIDMQLRSGVWGMTAASVTQARQLVGLGVRRILLANQVVEDRDVSWLSRHLAAGRSDDDFLCYVDSVAGLERLEGQLAREGGRHRQVGVLVELGYAGGRTGARSVEAAAQLARRVTTSPLVELRGVAGYEGLLPREGMVVPPGLPAYLQGLRDLLLACTRDGLFRQRPIVSAGGSSYFDFVVDHVGPRSFDFEVLTILRSGCYVAHDHGIYHETSPLDGRATGQDRLIPALELIATVVSRPEPDLAILNFGRRHAPTDDRLPLVLGVFEPDGSRSPLPEAYVRRVDDQHAYVVLPVGARVAPGDRVGLGISHPCGAFDRWREIPVVDRHYRPVDLASPLF
ncbi:amino acid deaminase [Nocardioides panacihumi]|uniref:Amino acid deaminase n=1 Tax=Nocardioides panacihumi TaxID=400774 RepID=A0ABP5D6V3_9ACTN